MPETLTRDNLDLKLDPIATDIAELKEAVTKQNGRIGVIERWKAYLTGGVSMLGLLAGGGGAAWMALFR